MRLTTSERIHSNPENEEFFQIAYQSKSEEVTLKALIGMSLVGEEGIPTSLPLSLCAENNILETDSSVSFLI